MSLREGSVHCMMRMEPIGKITCAMKRFGLGHELDFCSNFSRHQSRKCGRSISVYRLSSQSLSANVPVAEVNNGTHTMGYYTIRDEHWGRSLPQRDAEWMSQSDAKSEDLIGFAELPEQEPPRDNSCWAWYAELAPLAQCRPPSAHAEAGRRRP